MVRHAERDQPEVTPLAVNTGIQAICKSGQPVMVNYYNSGALIPAGTVVVIGSLPCIAHEDIPAFTGAPPLDALSVWGGVYIMQAGGAIGTGAPVYWDNTNKQVTTTSAGNTLFGWCVAGPVSPQGGGADAGLESAGPTTAGQYCLCRHAPAA
jgi:predicted RecA/RadA family phage recombinase